MAQTRLPFYFNIGISWLKLGPEFRSGTGAGGIWAGSGIGRFAGIRPVPRFFSARALKVAKTTVENRCSLKSENVEILLFFSDLNNLLREKKCKNYGHTPIYRL